MKPKTVTVSDEYTVRDKNKQAMRVHIEGRVTMCYEPNYGADADGNRGMGMWFAHEWDLKVYDIDDEDHAMPLENIDEDEIIDTVLADWSEE